MEYHFVIPENREHCRELTQDYFTINTKIWGDQAFDEYDTQNTRYVICVHSEFGVIGGLRLLSSSGPILSDIVLKKKGYVLSDKDVWEISKLFFYLPSSHPIQESLDDFNRICTDFYMGIWEFLTQVSDFESLITILPEVEHEDVRHFGQWPFNIESLVAAPYDSTPNDERYILGIINIGQRTE